MRHRLFLASVSLALLFCGTAAVAAPPAAPAPLASPAQVTGPSVYAAPFVSTFVVVSVQPICGVNIPTCYCKHC